jgi:hypothetical protein
MLANNEEHVLENDLNYSEFKNKPMIVVSDAMTSYPQAEQESLGPGGIGNYLERKLGYTQVMDVCFTSGSFRDLLAKLHRAIGQGRAWTNASIHIFLSLLRAPGQVISCDDENLRAWKEIVKLLKECKLRPYVVVNVTVLPLLRDAERKKQCREFIREMLQATEVYCLTDDGKRFWYEQYRFLEIADPLELARHLHLTVCRQRILMRLCPKHQGWETLEAAADTYIQTNKINPNALLDENHPVEENCDEAAAGGATPPDWDPPSSDEEYIKVDSADELFRLGTPTHDRY